jgi:hypothetical protein
MTVPGYTAEVALYRSTQTYRLSVPSGGGTERVQPAFYVGCYRQCARWCNPDDTACLHCCRCVCAGGDPNVCCF